MVWGWPAVCYNSCILGGIVRSALGVVFAVGLGACLAPTLPLPPPAAPTFSTDDEPVGQLKLTSPPESAEPNAIIFIYNLDGTLPDDQRVGGSQANGTGTWNAVIWGKSGDQLEIYQQVGGTWSTPLDVTIQLP
jgi:hypothetical protein